MARHEGILPFAGSVLAGGEQRHRRRGRVHDIPLLLAAGMTEVEANGSNFVAVLPASLVGTWVYRRELITVRRNLGLR